MRRILAVAVLALVVTGCSKSAKWVPSNTDRSQALEAAGPTAYARVCSAFEDYIHDEYASSYLVQALCTAHGIQTTETALACGDAVNACLEHLPGEVQSGLDAILHQASCDALNVHTEGCVATMGELVECLDALDSALTALKFSGVCAAAGKPVDDGWWHLQLPAACVSIQNRC